jgi:hypothetical protein
MTTKNTPVADYQQVTRLDLWGGRNGTFYRLTPVKGARVDGTVYVGMTSHEADDYSAVLPAKLTLGVSDQDQIHRFSDSPVNMSCRQVRRVTRQTPHRRSFAAVVQGPSSSGRSMTGGQAMFDVHSS